MLIIKKTSKVKLALNLITSSLLLIASTGAYATCATNTSNSSTSTLSPGVGDDCVLNSGTITVSGAHGIASSSSSILSTNSGTITTSGISAYGIASAGQSVINNNSGSITTNGNDNFGILSSGTSSTNTNSGTITTSGDYSYGIVSTGASTTNTNSGTITTSGAYGLGFFSQGASTTNTNSGTITTSGQNGYGLFSTGPNTTNTNSGTITTSGDDGYGIVSNGASSTNTNSGTITTSGDAGYGIYSLGVSSTNTNSGSITTTGTLSYGIYSSGLSSSVINSGTITTSGQYATGISNGFSDYGVIINTGTIQVSGPDSVGVGLGGDWSSLLNTGTIIGAARGVSVVGTNSTVNNYGVIKIIDSNSYSISIYNDHNTVNLLKGSVIVGDIYAGSLVTGAKLNINLGSGASYAYSVTGPWTVTDLDNRPMVTGSAYAAGIGAQETASQMLYQRTSSVTSALDRRLRSYASDETDNQPYWLDVYYSDVTRNSGGNYSTQTAFSNYNYGITAGFKLPNEVTPIELVVNFAQSNLNIDSGAQKIDSTSLMAGVLAPSITDVLGAKLSAKAMLGYAEHDGDRKVMTNSLLYDGSRQIKSDYNSVYGMAGAALTKIHPLTDHLSADVLLGLDLNVQRYESYKESDYFAWDSRTLTQLQSRVQVGLSYAFNENKASVFARVGAENRNLIGGATQDYEINNTAVSFNTNNKNDTYLTAQVGIKAQLEKRIQLFGVVNTLHSSDSVNSVSGNIGLRADF